MIGNTEDGTESVAAASVGPTLTSTDATERKPSTVVIETVADVCGVEPTDLGTALYDCIDPDALDELFAPTLAGRRRGVGVVTFTMEGCDVSVYDDGTVEVRGPPAR